MGCYCTRWLSFFCDAKKKHNKKTVVCMFLQEGCGEGCSQGLPGVPGMAGAKGEKGEEGKPGVNPLDSCDRVRLWGTGSFCWNMFSFTWTMIIHFLGSYETSLIVQSLCLSLCFDEMQNGSASFCIVFKFSWLDARSHLTWCSASSKTLI